MDAKWEIRETDFAKWRELYLANKNKKIPRYRRDRNVKRNGITLTKATIWHALVVCQVTTQQRSGPDSSVSQFLRSKSPALNFSKCRGASSVQDMIARECTNAGLRRAPTIAGNLQRIYSTLEDGEWSTLIAQLRTLLHETSREKERDVISYLLSRGGKKSSHKYPGLGQKQARNFIQHLGLSRHEIPLDSRILKKLKEFGSGFVPSGAALTDEAVYLFVQGALQDIANALGIYPCELDACIFVSYNVDEGSEDADEELQSPTDAMA